MNRFTLVVGFGNESQEKTAVKKSLLCENATLLFGAYTYTQGEGGWTNDAGGLCFETVGRLDIYTERDSDYCIAFAEAMAVRFEQDCVAMEYTPAPSFGIVYGRALA
jgi:hypothetical protein